jgi:hypothetical protein
MDVPLRDTTQKHVTDGIVALVTFCEQIRSERREEHCYLRWHEESYTS